MKKAILYRMVMHDHICPFGTKAKYLLETEGFEVEDHHLRTREETDAFKQKHDVKTTPQTFIDGKRVGGYDDLRTYFKKTLAPKKGQSSYKAIITLFGMSFVMALGISFGETRVLPIERVLHLFVALSMCLLAMEKLKDLFSFSNGFLNYDLMARKFVPYSYVYPFLEAFAGLAMLGMIWPLASGVVAILIGTEGAVSVFKAVYLDKRALKCACVGGDSNVPLGFVSLTENLMMIAMGAWTLIR